MRRAVAAHGADGVRAGFRIVHFNVQSNHVHLICEADGATALARGMQGFAVRVARGVNRAEGRRGTLFSERYHARSLRTPREVRHALRYVLCNSRHHAAERGEKLARFWIDPCSSAAWFDGWRDPIRTDDPTRRQLVKQAPPTAPASVWLLTTGWRRHGPIAFDELGRAWRRERAGGTGS